MKAEVTFFAVLTLAVGALTGCDPYWQLVVTAPLVRPVPTECIRSALDTITRSVRPVEARPDSTLPKGTHGTVFLFGGDGPSSTLRQYEDLNGTAALETQVGRIPARRYSKSEADRLGPLMGAMLLRVRDACGGAGASGSPPYAVKRKPL